MIVDANGVQLYVETHGDGDPVLLLHGWPDSSALWRNQVPFLTSNGFRVITPDLRGFGRSSRPEGKDSYRLRNSVADVAAVLDAAGAPAAHVVGHDWGAAVAWLTAMYLPDRVRTLTAISVPHLGVPDDDPPAGDGLVPALLPVRGDRGGHAQARRLGRPARARPRLRRPRSRGRRPVPARRAHRLAQLVPRQPRAADAWPAARAAAGHRPRARHLVRRGPVPGRRADARLRGHRQRPVAVRRDLRGDALDTAGRSRAAQRAAAGLAL